jgi:hypothetical protein
VDTWQGQCLCNFPPPHAIDVSVVVLAALSDALMSRYVWADVALGSPVPAANATVSRAAAVIDVRHSYSALCTRLLQVVGCPPHARSPASDSTACTCGDSMTLHALVQKYVVLAALAEHLAAHRLVVPVNAPLPLIASSTPFKALLTLGADDVIPGLNTPS